MKILIIGAGAYGLALSTVLSEKNEVTIYSSLKDEIDDLNKTNKSILFPNIELPQTLKYINNTKNIDTDLIIIALPTNIIKQELEKIKENINEKKPIIIASKGIHEDKFIHDIVKETLNTSNIYVLSGPSFAKDMIKKDPLILTLAGENAKDLKQIFTNEYLKIETTNDIIGTEICGTLKNIFAIGSGILEGMNVSNSTKAAYLTKIINETKNILEKLNCNKENVLLSCGIGDIILTCTSKNSRNYSLGYMLGKNEPKEKINEYLKTTTVEGLTALMSIKQKLEEENINIEIINLIYDIIYNNVNTQEILKYIIKQ